MKVSWAWKDGAVIKIKKRDTPPLRAMLFRVLRNMVRDLENHKTKRCETRIELGDARMLPLEDGLVDAVITSPPYLNQIDYLRAYEIENWIIGASPEPMVRSVIGAGKAEEFLEEESMPPQARAYLKDMRMAISEMGRVCKIGAQVGIVIGNAYFPEGIVESDIWIGKFGEEAGFSVNEIVVLNKRPALVRRTHKVGELRESLVLLRK
jgi:DNA modification methylase